MLLDRGLGLFERHAGHEDAAVGAEVDRAVRADEVLAGDLLLAGGLRERERNLRILEDPLEMPVDGILGLLQRLVAHHHLAVRRAEVEHAPRLHDIQTVDRLLEERALDDHLERIERLDAKRRLGHDAEGVDEEDVRRLDHVGGKGDLRQFLGGHAARFGRALGIEHHLLGGRSLGAAVDVAARRLEQHGRESQDRAAPVQPDAPANPLPRLTRHIRSDGFENHSAAHGALLTTGTVTVIGGIVIFGRQTLPFLPVGKRGNRGNLAKNALDGRHHPFQGVN